MCRLEHLKSMASDSQGRRSIAPSVGLRVQTGGLLESWRRFFHVSGFSNCCETRRESVSSDVPFGPHHPTDRRRASIRPLVPAAGLISDRCRSATATQRRPSRTRRQPGSRCCGEAGSDRPPPELATRGFKGDTPSSDHDAALSTAAAPACQLTQGAQVLGPPMGAGRA